MRVGSSHAARVISLWPQLCDRALDSALPHLMAYKRNVKMRLKLKKLVARNGQKNSLFPIVGLQYFELTTGTFDFSMNNQYVGSTLCVQIVGFLLVKTTFL